MTQLIDKVNKSRTTKLSNSKRSPLYIKDKELHFVCQLLDDLIINRLLANKGYNPTMCDIFPNNLLRVSLLYAMMYTVISYRKFCKEECLGLDRQQNRVLIGLT
jgi:hypothetical protein